MEKSKSTKEISELTGIEEWRVKNYCTLNGGLSRDTIKKKLELITQLQFNNMIGNYNKDILFEIFVNK